MLSALKKRWLLPRTSAEIEKLADDLQISPLIAQLLFQRGLTSVETARSFLNPGLKSLGHPFSLTDLEKAAERLWKAIDLQESIVLFGDYDVDGITSVALLGRILQKLGARVKTFLPFRMEEGYGLSQEAVERCVEEHRPQLLVAVDCGTTALSPISFLNEKGIDVVVIDHHALPPKLPQCHALVNPQRDTDWRYLASVGLVFKVCHGMRVLRREAFLAKARLSDYLDLVAVGTVADLVPLQGENRVFVKMGLQELSRPPHGNSNPGLRELIRVARIKSPLTTSDIGFRIGPRINASGRLADAGRSLALLTSDNETELRAIAAELEENNRQRQTVELAVFEEANELLAKNFDPQRDWAIVIAKKGWHIGVIGIVASRLQRLYHRPIIVIGIDDEGIGKGSGRSIDGFSIVAGLEAVREHLVLFGGHEMAAGLTIKEEKVESLRAALNLCARKSLTEQQLQPSLVLSSETPLPGLDENFYYALQSLAPFGRDNPEPVFLFEAPASPLVRPFGTNHCELVYPAGEKKVRVVSYNTAHLPIPEKGHYLAGVLEWDDWRGALRMKLIDWCDAETFAFFSKKSSTASPELIAKDSALSL